LLTRTLAGVRPERASVDIAKDAEQRSYKPMVGVATRVATERLLSRIPVLALVGEICRSAISSSNWELAGARRERSVPRHRQGCRAAVL